MYFKMLFIPVNFQHHDYSVSHDPSEIILICWFGAQEKFIISICKLFFFSWIFD